MIHTGHIKNNNLVLYDKPKFRKDLERFDGKQVELILREKKKNKRRTAGQYAYLFGYVYQQVVDHLGYTKNEVDKLTRRRMIESIHEGMKQEINPVVVEVFDMNTKLNLTEMRGGSTTKLNCSKLADFITQVIAIWSIEGVDFGEQLDDWVAEHEDEVDRYYRRI
ncbi:MAG: hypothetical protein ACTSYY_12875 [Promethearchaeota archaeon]